MTGIRLMLVIAVAISLLGCSKEETVTGKDEAPKGAASSERGVTGGGPATAPKPDIK